MSTRRHDIESVEKSRTTHAGLWLDKYIRSQNLEKEKNLRDLFLEVAGLNESLEYVEFFKRWKKALVSRGAVMREASVQGRMAVGLGDESVLETSVTLHHTYGVPNIPGSAVKGAAASYARQKLDPKTWGVDSPAYKALFGYSDEAGYVTFFDALHVPGSGHNGQALHLDVITVHHQKYYQHGTQAPADWDSPTPIHFLSTTGKYLIALAGPSEWVAAAFDILALALPAVGIGAKTSGGYGRMAIEPPSIAVKKQFEVDSLVPASAEHLGAASFLREIEALRNDRVAPEIPHFVERWRRLEVNDRLKREIAVVILAKIRKARREKASAGKPWYQELLDSQRQ